MEINWIKDSTETLSKNAELWDLTRTNTELNKQFEQTTKKPRGGGGEAKKRHLILFLFFYQTLPGLCIPYMFS